MGKTWDFKSKLGRKKPLKFGNYVFENSLSRCHLQTRKIWFTSLSYSHYQHKHWFSQIDLWFHCFYLEITWKIHGILYHHRSGNPVFAVQLNMIGTGGGRWKVIIPAILILRIQQKWIAMSPFSTPFIPPPLILYHLTSLYSVKWNIYMIFNMQQKSVGDSSQLNLKKHNIY